MAILPISQTACEREAAQGISGGRFCIKVPLVC